MPTYTFRDKTTGEESEHFMRISDLDTFKVENPQLQQVPTAFAIGDPIRLGVSKISPVLRDALKSMKQANKGSTIQV